MTRRHQKKRKKPKRRRVPSRQACTHTDDRRLSVWAQERLGEFEHRRQTYDRFLAHSNIIYHRHTCPACGLPTLDDGESYQTCIICLWEDCGLDDPHARRQAPPNYVSLLSVRIDTAELLRRFLRTHSIDGRPDRVIRAIKSYEQNLRNGTQRFFEQPFARLRACLPLFGHSARWPRYFRPYRWWRDSHPVQCGRAARGDHPVGPGHSSWPGAKCRNCTFRRHEIRQFFWGEEVQPSRCTRHGRSEDRSDGVRSRWQACGDWRPVSQPELADEAARVAAIKKLSARDAPSAALRDAAVTALDVFERMQARFGDDAGGYWLAWVRQQLGEARGSDRSTAEVMLAATQALDSWSQ